MIRRRDFTIRGLAALAAGLAYLVTPRGRAQGPPQGAALKSEPPPMKLPDIGGEARPWTHLNFNANPDHFHFVITADITGNERPGVWEDALAKINLLRPEFAITIGDLVEGYVENEHLIQRSFEIFDQRMKSLEVPFFYVAGNHDISNEAMAEGWRQQYGAEYYHFIYKGVLFLCLQSTDKEHYRLGSEQIEYFRTVLRENPEVRWTNVFVHDPLWTYDWNTGWEVFEQLLQDRPYTVFAGHIHLYAKTSRLGRDYYILATTGGASTTAGPNVDGQFDHLMWVTMTEQGPVVLNLELKGLHKGDVRNETQPEVQAQLEVKRSFMETAAKRMGSYRKA